MSEKKYCKCRKLSGSFSRVRFDRDVKAGEAEAVFYGVLYNVPGAAKVLEETIHCSDCKFELKEPDND